MDTAFPQKYPFIFDRNLAKANCTGNRGCTSCDIVLDIVLNIRIEYAVMNIYIYILYLIPSTIIHLNSSLPAFINISYKYVSENR